MKLYETKEQGQHTPKRFFINTAQSVEKQQRKIADFLASKTQYWNGTSKIIALLLFCVLFGSACLILIIKALNHI